MSMGIWFPTVRTNTGTDVFTEQLAGQLEKAGLRVAIDWLPLRAEYAPWSVPKLSPPSWAKILHVNSWLAPCLIPTGPKVLTTIHHSIHDPRLLPYKGRARRWYHSYWIQRQERRNLVRADAVVAVSYDAAYWARKILGATKVQVIHNGIDISGVEFIDRDAPNHPFRLIYVGTWIQRKGVDMLSEIMLRLGSDFELLCIGGSPSEKERRLFPGNVRFLGGISDRRKLLSIMGAADALLFPSRSEGLSLALIEAQASGLVALTSDCSSMPEIVINGNTGLLCEPGNPIAFVDAARRIKYDFELWKKLRKSAREHMVERFSMDRQVLGYISVYDSIIKS